MASNMAGLNPYMKQFLPEGGVGKQAMQDSFKDASVQKRVFAEFVGTFVLVFTVGLAKTAGADNAGLADFAPTAIGCILMVMVYSLGKVSGGHFNPAVSFACLLHKNMKPMDAILYLIAQSAAGALAGLATAVLSAANVDLQPVDGGFFIGAPLVEFIYTFMLCFVFLNVAVAAKKRDDNHYYGIAIGFVVIAAGYGGGQISGGAFNPAIAIGINFMGHDITQILWLPLYLVVQFAGAFLSVIALHIVREEEREKTETEGFSPSKIANKIMSKLDSEDCAELIGTFLLSYTFGLNFLSEQKLGSHSKANPGGVWSIGACLMCLCYAIGDVSGGLFNPALTLAILGRYYKTGKEFAKDGLCDPMMAGRHKEGLKYLAAQFVGGAIGAFAVWGTYFVFSTANNSWPPSTNVPPPACIYDSTASKTKCTDNSNLLQYFFAEMFGTLLFSYAFLCVATVRKPLDEYKPFAIGCCLIGIGYAFGPFSGGFVNPAVSVSYAAFNDLSLVTGFGPGAIFLAELIGGLLAAVLFKFLTHADEYEDWERVGGSA